jgi:pimeloyl-ACP methyl ester carboxylesterase
MQPLIEHRMKLDGYDTRVLELEGDGPGIVLFHGYADSADTWRPLLAELAHRDRRAVAVDLPGFGAAARLRPGPVLEQYDDFAGALIDEWAEGRPVIAAGNSLGGVVVLRTAEREDLPLAGVAPIAPAGLDMPRWFDVIDRDPVIRTLLSLPVPIPRQVLELSVGTAYRQLAFSNAGAADRRVVANFCSHFGSRSRVGELLATGRRLLPELQQLPFRFERIRVPVLLVWGTGDRMVSHSGAERLSQALPDARVELLEGVGHCPQLEATQRVAELLLEFGSADTIGRPDARSAP